MRAPYCTAAARARSSAASRAAATSSSSKAASASEHFRSRCPVRSCLGAYTLYRYRRLVIRPLSAAAGKAKILEMERRCAKRRARRLQVKVTDLHEGDTHLGFT